MPDAIQVIHGDSRELIATLDDLSVHACISDPPYEINFMGRKWDNTGIAIDPAFWALLLPKLRPAAHVAAFGASRRQHRLACAIEDAGFEIRDALAWLYGQGFPKSMSIDKVIDRRRRDDPRLVCEYLRAAIDASEHTSATIAPFFGVSARMVDHWAARATDSQPTCATVEQWECLREILAPHLGADMDEEVERLNERKGTLGDSWLEREVIAETDGQAPGLGGERFVRVSRQPVATVAKPAGVGAHCQFNGVAVVPDDARKAYQVTAPASQEAKEWAGYGTALKPAYEPIVLARAPFVGSLVENVLAYGSGALNIDAARIAHDSATLDRLDAVQRTGASGRRVGGVVEGAFGADALIGSEIPIYSAAGRWPANVVCDLEAAAEIDRQSGQSKTPATVTRGGSRSNQSGMLGLGAQDNVPSYGDEGGASRFFYCAKPDVAERECGLDELVALSAGELTGGRKEGSAGLDNPRAGAGRTAEGGRKNSHATVKPIDLMRWLVRLLTRPGDLVFDPFTGSGTTAIACALEGRRFIGFELDERHVAIAHLRVAAALRGDLRVGSDGKTQARKTVDKSQLSILDF